MFKVTYCAKGFFMSAPTRLYSLCILLAIGHSFVPSEGSASISQEGGDPLADFLTPASKPSYSLSISSEGLFSRRFNPIRRDGSVFGTKPRKLLLYSTLAGERYGLPIMIDMGDFITLKLKENRKEAFVDYFVKHEADLTGQAGGLLNVTIPVSIPKGLSAITGEGATQIEITGRRSIIFSGRSDYIVGQVQSVANQRSRFPTINFEQESEFKVRGQIGDRITIDLEQDSRNPNDLASSLRLSYKGPEDAIIQEIEAGNTQLSLPGTRLVGFSQGRGGLFGIRGKGTIGGLDFTVITSQDKGSANRKTFRGQSQESSNRIRDFQYIQNTYFFLDDTYRDAFQSGTISPGDLVIDESVEVFVNDFNPRNDIERRAISAVANAYAQKNFPADTLQTSGQTGGREAGFFHKLDRTEFQAFQNGYIILKQRISDFWALGVAYKTQGRETFGDVNFVVQGDKAALFKLIKARNQRPPTPANPNAFPTWRLMWKNVYSLGGRNVERAGFSIKVFRDVAGQEPLDHQNGKSYLQILGIDRHGQTASSPPDNLIDLDEDIVDLVRGELIFPFLEPFGDRGVGSPDLENRVPEIYDEVNPTTRSEKSQYSLEVQSQSRQTQFNLGFGDVIPNSEQVRLNGRLLKRFQDYTVDYVTGSLSFQPAVATEAANPSASLDITWDSQSLFGFAAQKKSLLGFRAEHKLSGGEGQSYLGLTFLYSNQTTPSRRVRVGQEPSRSMVLDANARLEFRPQLLTDLVNSLPLVEAHTPSVLRINTEIAQSLPNPNTKGSAYIDDFEGSANTIPLSIFRAAWTTASDPTGKDLPPARLVWYNPFERVRITDIQPHRAENITVEQNIDDILVLKFFPSRRGFLEDLPRGYEPQWEDGEPRRSWGGIQTSTRGGVDLSRSKFLEIWVRGNEGLLNVEIGEISEDLTLPFDEGPNGRLDTEDVPIEGFPTGDNILAESEDIGLDGMTDAEEQARFSEAFSDLDTPDDPSGDNWFYESRSTDYERINGLEGNGLRDGERAGIPDTEDINGNSILDTRNDFWRYSVDLSSDFEEGLRAEGTESDGSLRPWRLIRIPLRDDRFRTKVGNPEPNLSTAIDFARIWIEHDDTTTVEIYQVYFTLTDWQENPLSATQSSDPIKITSRNTARDAFYDPPPGLELERNVDNPSIKVPETSLALQFGELHLGEAVSATRVFPSGETYTDYSRMQMYVHGGNGDPNNNANGSTFPASSDTLNGSSPIELFLRFSAGSQDTSNFYEYRTRVYQGWDPLNEVDVSMTLMSQIKGVLFGLRSAPRDSAGSVAVDSSDVPPGVSDFTYRPELNEVEAAVGLGANRKTYIVRGNPAFSGIRTFTIGIRNAGETVISGSNGQNEIWVDELRVDNIRKRRAFSGDLDVDMQLSDFGRMRLGLSHQGGDFQDLRSRATGIAKTALSLSNTFNLERFFPTSWGLNVPFSLSIDRNTQTPRIRRGSDIVLTTEQRRDESDISSRMQTSISFRKQPARENPRLLSRLFFDRVTSRMSINTQDRRSGAITQRRHGDNRSISGSFDYNLAPKKPRSFRPMAWMPLKSLKKLEFKYLPNVLRYSATVNQNISNSNSFSAVGGDTTNQIITNSETFDMSETYTAKLNPFRSLSTGYNLGIRRDLQGAFKPEGLQFGKEVGRTQNADISLSITQIKWFNQSYSYNARYAESNDPRGAGFSRGVQGRRGRDANTNSQLSARYNLNLPLLFRKLSKSSRRYYSKTGLSNNRSKDREAGGFPVLGWIGQMGGKLRNVSLQASRKKTANLFGLVGRPGLIYQLGFSDTTDVDRTEARGVTRIDAFSTTDQMRSDGGVNLPFGMSVNSRYEYTREKRTGNSANSPELHNITTRFPSVNASWGALGRMPVVRWIFTSASADASYERNKTRRGEGGTGPRNVLKRQEETNFKPFALNLQWKGRVNMNIQRTDRNSREVDFQSNEGDTVRAVLGNSQLEGRNMTASLRYSFSPTSGLLKRFNLKSNVDLTLEFSQRSNLNKRTPPGSEKFSVQQDDNQWSIGLSSSYRFNQNFTGSMRLRHENQEDRLRQQTRKVWDFGFKGDIVFN